MSSQVYKKTSVCAGWLVTSAQHGGLAGVEAPVLSPVQFSNSDVDRRVCSQPKEHPGNAAVRAEAAFNYRSHSLVFTVYKQGLLEKL